jgi:hypothetical protein
MSEEIVPFSEAIPGMSAYTYRRADGELTGDFGWVTDLEWFDDTDEDIVRLRRQRWVLADEDIIEVVHRTTLCPICHGDGAVRSVLGNDIDCQTCNGSGTHPHAGTSRVIPKEGSHESE